MPAIRLCYGIGSLLINTAGNLTLSSGFGNLGFVGRLPGCTPGTNILTPRIPDRRHTVTAGAIHRFSPPQTGKYPGAGRPGKGLRNTGNVCFHIFRNRRNTICKMYGFSCLCNRHNKTNCLCDKQSGCGNASFRHRPDGICDSSCTGLFPVSQTVEQI